MGAVKCLFRLSVFASLAATTLSLSILSHIPRDALDDKTVVYDEELPESLRDMPVQNTCFYIGRLIVGVEPPALPHLQYSCPDQAFTGGGKRRYFEDLGLTIDCYYDDVPLKYTGNLVNGSVDQNLHSGKILICIDTDLVPSRIKETCAWALNNVAFHCRPKGKCSSIEHA
jgi:hypothetical protein